MLNYKLTELSKARLNENEHLIAKQTNKIDLMAKFDSQEMELKSKQGYTKQHFMIFQYDAIILEIECLIKSLEQQEFSRTKLLLEFLKIILQELIMTAYNCSRCKLSLSGI
ncbi:CLUMA_CG020131, isoform A [Clunio marinus]|uniref:CLUMA_CG020131, isoform A n=1 Tax=Clunio marinus TaxID=568069 RepID=A0A1J1J400_9DIPT|nr:CLUMA_CG020131, isoform A [Clunio marinus]